METEVQEQRKPFGQSLAEAIKPFEEGLSVKPESKPEPKPDTKPDPKPEVKVQPKELKPEPKVEAKDLDDDIISGKRNPKGEDFKRVKTAAAEAAKQRDEIKARAETFEKELTELKKAPKHNAELISKIEKERDDFRVKYEQVALAFDPDFNAGYQSKIDSVLANVKKMVPAERAEDLAQVLQMPEGARKKAALLELTEDLDQFTINDLSQAKRDIQSILSEREGRIKKSQEGLTALAKERQEKAEAQKTGRTKLFDTVISKAMEENPVFKKREGDSPEVQAWNQAVDARAESARRLFMGDVEDDSTRADAALWATAAPGFLEQLKTVQAERDELKATLDKMQSASPGISSGNAAGKAETGQPGSFASKVAASLAGR